MKFNSTFIALSVSALIFSGMANAAITGTSSAEMTFTSTVTSGTCTAIATTGGASTTEVKFGTVYKSDLVKKSRVEPMSISFSNCSGVTKAQVTAIPGVTYGCSGPNGDGDSYGANKQAVGFEVWSGAVDTGLLLSCNKTVTPQDVTISGGVGEFPVNTRIVIGKDYTAADLVTGAIASQVSFVITYP